MANPYARFSRKQALTLREEHFNRLELIDNILPRLMESAEDLAQYRTLSAEGHWIYELINSKARMIDKEADLIITTIGMIDERLIGHNLQYFGNCNCIACKEGIYDKRWLA